MEVKYIKVFVDNLEVFESLNNAQRGMLITAMLQYAKDRVEPELKGVVKHLFPMFKAQIDREIVGMEETAKTRSKAAKNRFNGLGRANSANASKCKQMHASVTNASKCKQMLTSVTSASKCNIENREQNTEYREPITDNRLQSTEDREERIENRVQNPAPESSPASAHVLKERGVYGWIRLSDEQVRELSDQMGDAELGRIIQYVDELVQSNGNKYQWKDWMLVLRRAYREGWGQRERLAEKSAAVEGRNETSYDLEEIEMLI